MRDIWSITDFKEGWKKQKYGLGCRNAGNN